MFQKTMERLLPFFIFFDIFLFCGIIFLKLYLFARFAQVPFLVENIIQVTVGSIFLISALFLLLKGKKRWYGLYGLNVFLTLVIFSDLIYFRYFGDFITIPVLLQAKQVSSLGGSIFELVSLKDSVFFLDIVLFPLLFFYMKGLRVQEGFGKRLSLTVFFLVTGYFLVSSPIQAYIEKYGKNLFINNWSNISVYQQTGQIGFHAYDMKKFLDERFFNKTTITEEEKREIKRWLEASNTTSNDSYYGIAEGKNVLIIQLESFQNYVLDASLNGQEITPNLNALKEEMMYFSNFHHQVGQGRTSDAEFIANTSMFPLPVGSVYVRYPTNEYDSLSKILKEHGYYTSVFHAYDKNFWNRNLMYQTYQFDEFYGKGDFAEGEMIGPFGTQGAIGDNPLFQQTIDVVKDKEEPFYSFVVALTSHHPYSNIPSEYRTLDVGLYEGTILGDYFHSIHYVDRAVGNLVQRLKDEDLWDDTILVMYGDHDSGVDVELSQATDLEMPATELDMKLLKYEVPLFVHIPGTNENGTFEHTTGMIDITPSILHLLGIPSEGLHHFGKSIFDFENHFIPFRYGSFTNGNVFFEASIDTDFTKGLCYDYATKQQVDNVQCKEGSQEIWKRLSYSDKIIYHNLLKEWD